MQPLTFLLIGPMWGSAVQLRLKWWQSVLNCSPISSICIKQRLFLKNVSIVGLFTAFNSFKNPSSFLLVWCILLYEMNMKVLLLCPHSFWALVIAGNDWKVGHERALLWSLRSQQETREGHGVRPPGCEWLNCGSGVGDAGIPCWFTHTKQPHTRLLNVEWSHQAGQNSHQCVLLYKYLT